MLSTNDLQKQFSNEQVFIILLTRSYLGVSSKEAITSFCGTNVIDYNEIWKISAAHGIRPFLYYIIQLTNIEIDLAFVLRLKKFYLENQLRSLEQLSICYNVVNDLTTKGITAIPFKGAIFSEVYYNNVGLRESTDIDLFIDEKYVAAAEILLQAKAFQPKLAVPGSYLEYYKRNFKEIVYTIPAKTKKEYSGEIHWKLLNYYFGEYPGFDFFSTRVHTANIKQFTFQLLEPTADFLAVVSNHFIKDLGVKFKYVVDLAVLLQKQGDRLDFDLITHVGDTYKCRKKIDLAFYTIEQLTGLTSAYKNKYKFSNTDLGTNLSVPLSIRDFQVSTPSFLKRSLELQDDKRSKLTFIGRCMYYFFLPTDNDLRPYTKTRIPVLLLALARPFRLGIKALLKQNH